MKAKRTGFGRHPQTRGWQSMMRWIKEHGGSVGALATAAGVTQPSAHAWRWRDSVPTGEVLERLCKVIDCKPADWEVQVNRHGEVRA